MNMQSLHGLNLVPVWVNPDHLIESAQILLSGHRLKVLGVVEGTKLVGVITSAQTLVAPEGARVGELMRPPEHVVEADTPVRQVAETFWQEDLDYIPVMQDARFQGIVTPNMLLKEMARSWDPLTGLSWSDSLREWGVENLKVGREITILFIDLDEFGAYNKRYGHIVGDRVLKKVAETIQAKLGPDRDLLVRYGGDEFAVGTLRDQGDAVRLAQDLQGSIATLRVAGSDEPVTVCIGVQGGKRTKERENVHYAATLDNLINLASKACMAQKAAHRGGAAVEPSPMVAAPAAAAIAEPEPPAETDDSAESVTPETAADLAEGHGEVTRPEGTTAGDVAVVEVPVETDQPRSQTMAVTDAGIEAAPSGPMSIAEVSADAADANSVTQVSIQVGERAITGVCPRKGGSVIKSVALATTNALSQIRPDVKLEIREVNLSESDTGVRFISVIGTGKVNGDEQPIGGIGTVGRNLYQTVAEATLQAYTNFEAVNETV